MVLPLLNSSPGLPPLLASDWSLSGKAVGGRGELAGPVLPSLPGSCMTQEPGQLNDIMKHEDQEPRQREEEGLGRKSWVLDGARTL